MEDTETPVAEQKTLMQKTPDELTVGDAIKLNLGTLAVMAAIPAVWLGGVAGVEKFKVWRKNRQIAKAVEAEQTAMEAHFSES